MILGSYIKSYLKWLIYSVVWKTDYFGELKTIPKKDYLFGNINENGMDIIASPVKQANT